MTSSPVHIVGGGLAGCEAAWQLALRGVPSIIHEVRFGERLSEAHRTDTLAELVCSNSFRSDDHETNAVGQLHWELRQADSLIMRSADAHKVPAGSALAVDREGFALAVQSAILTHPLITVKREEIPSLNHFNGEPTLIATGPLTSSALADDIRRHAGEDSLAFFDAIAPIIYKESINFSIAWMQSRYDKGDGKDYINCPMNEAQYKAFVALLNTAEKVEFKEWEKNTPYFEGCLPIEVMAERGVETLRFGCMKPVGLTNPHTHEPAYAVVQLRQDNALGTLYNMVGFQTKLTYGAQKEVFRTIPALENAEFARLGGIHRNTFINSPKLLTPDLRFKPLPHVRFAGQITGVEGYVESTAIGLVAGRLLSGEGNVPPATTSIGSLISHITTPENADTFQPMNANFGLYQPLEKRHKRANRKQAYTERAKADFSHWLGARIAA